MRSMCMYMYVYITWLRNVCVHMYIQTLMQQVTVYIYVYGAVVTLNSIHLI